jgi:hypothetical protein
MLGIQNATHFDQRYQEHYHELVKSQPTLKQQGQVEIEGKLNERFLQKKAERKSNQIDFCFLFYASFLYLSNESQIFQLLKSDQIDAEKCMENCKKLLFNPLSRQQ